MIVSSNHGSFFRGKFAGTMGINCDFIDIHFNYCGEDIWISIPIEDFNKMFESNSDHTPPSLKCSSVSTTVTYDYPLDAETLLKKIKKLKVFKILNQDEFTLEHG